MFLIMKNISLNLLIYLMQIHNHPMFSIYNVIYLIVGL